MPGPNVVLELKGREMHIKFRTFGSANLMPTRNNRWPLECNAVRIYLNHWISQSAEQLSFVKCLQQARLPAASPMLDFLLQTFLSKRLKAIVHPNNWLVASLECQRHLGSHSVLRNACLQLLWFKQDEASTYRHSESTGDVTLTMQIHAFATMRIVD